MEFQLKRLENKNIDIAIHSLSSQNLLSSLGTQRKLKICEWSLYISVKQSTCGWECACCEGGEHCQTQLWGQRHPEAQGDLDQAR